VYKMEGGRVVWGSEPQSPLKGQLLYMMTFCFAFYESCLSTVQTGGGGGGGVGPWGGGKNGD
jgi:hypothetical protein